MDEYKYQRRKYVRGDHCCASIYNKESNTWFAIHCSCGSRVPPEKKDRNRINRRLMQRDLQDRIKEDMSR